MNPLVATTLRMGVSKASAAVLAANPATLMAGAVIVIGGVIVYTVFVRGKNVSFSFGGMTLTAEFYPPS